MVGSMLQKQVFGGKNGTRREILRPGVFRLPVLRAFVAEAAKLLKPVLQQIAQSKRTSKSLDARQDGVFRVRGIDRDAASFSRLNILSSGAAEP